jgi:DNA-binding transcriptional MerR regulator
MSPLPDVEFGNAEPLYNIGVVARMTGISMATLRAWERRYDFPESERTAGGHRLYSERDVLRLRWVKARIDEGMQTAQSINALRHQEETGHLLLAPVVGVGAEIEPAAGQKEQDGHLREKRQYLHVYQERLLEALIHRNFARADELLGEALMSTTPEDVILQMIGPVISRTGTLWELNEINVATEHMATNYLRQRLMTWMLSGPPPVATPPVVLACAPDEWHEGGLLIIGALLRRRRWPVAYLGQSLPLEDLALFTNEIRPHVVVLVAMTENTASAIAQWPRYLPDAAENKQPIITYAGRVFVEQPEWRLRVPGMYLGDRFEDGVKTIERLMSSGKTG